jgi:hypothetical protein
MHDRNFAGRSAQRGCSIQDGAEADAKGEQMQRG